MPTNPCTSIDAALDYARDAVGAKKAAELLRAATFAGTIREGRTLRPQVANALVRAVDRIRQTAN